MYTYILSYVELRLLRKNEIATYDEVKKKDRERLVNCWQLALAIGCNTNIGLKEIN